MRERSDCIQSFETSSKLHMCEHSSHIRKPGIECESEAIAFKSSNKVRDSEWRGR